MRVFFDNCTSPVLAHVLDALLSPQGGRAEHVREMPLYGFDGRSADEEWIGRLAQDAPKDWIVVTGDHRIRKNKAERRAWNRSGLKGFVLAPSYQKTPLNRVAAILLWRWPEMERFIASAAAGSLFELPISRSGKFRPLTV